MLPATKRSQVVRRHVRPDLTALNSTRILIESEVDPAKHAGVVDVVREIVERLVAKEHPWHARVRQLEANVMPSEQLFGDLTRSIAG